MSLQGTIQDRLSHVFRSSCTQWIWRVLQSYERSHQFCCVLFQLVWRNEWSTSGPGHGGRTAGHEDAAGSNSKSQTVNTNGFSFLSNTIKLQLVVWISVLLIAILLIILMHFKRCCDAYCAVAGRCCSLNVQKQSHLIELITVHTFTDISVTLKNHATSSICLKYWMSASRNDHVNKMVFFYPEFKSEQQNHQDLPQTATSDLTDEPVLANYHLTHVCKIVNIQFV